MRKVCGTCRHNRRDFSKPQDGDYCKFSCGNEEGEFYGVPTFYDDTCDGWEGKEEMLDPGNARMNG